MKKFQIFVSSTFSDLRTERESVIRAVLEMGHIPVGMEMFSAADEEQWKLIARQIEQSDYYVVIVAHRYGSVTGGVSYTEKEYDYALSQGVPILGFVIEESAPWPNSQIEKNVQRQLKAFKAKVQQRHISFWTSVDDLYGKVAIALMKQFATTPRPGWVRANESIDPSVVNELSRLSEENHQLREDLAKIKTADQGARLPDLDSSLSFRVYGTSTSTRQAIGLKNSVKLTWKDLLEAIGVDLLEGTDVQGVSLRLLKLISKRMAKNVPSSAMTLEDNDLNFLKLELMALGLIDIKPETILDSDNYPSTYLRWQMTIHGRRALLEKRDELFYEAKQNGT